jgi:orotidine-5'-phosphate decarboxylase
MTVTAYLGFGALRPVLDRAANCNGAAFVIVRSSNSEGCSGRDGETALRPNEKLSAVGLHTTLSRSLSFAFRTALSVP